jgi:hypothetical protein
MLLFFTNYKINNNPIIDVINIDSINPNLRGIFYIIYDANKYAKN